MRKVQEAIRNEIVDGQSQESRQFYVGTWATVREYGVLEGVENCVQGNSKFQWSEDSLKVLEEKTHCERREDTL